MSLAAQMNVNDRHRMVKVEECRVVLSGTH